MLINGGSDKLCFPGQRQTRQPNKQDTACEPTLAKGKLAKVLVCRQEQVCLLLSQIQHDIIRHAWLHFGDVPYRVAVLSQPVHKLAIYTLVGQKSHAMTSATG
jgi:hypothetical protein